jgi:hypothetical protein
MYFICRKASEELGLVQQYIKQNCWFLVFLKSFDLFFKSVSFFTIFIASKTQLTLHANVGSKLKKRQNFQRNIEI